jgi:para-nitrobenzyl esterase
MKTMLTLLALLLMSLNARVLHAQTPNDPIAVEGGLISGVATEVPGVTLYKAVPFAAPPVGLNRWRAPQPVVPWTGVRESAAWPNRCYQLASANPPGTFYFNEFYWDPSQDPKDSEDCLYLNIWAPVKSAGATLPVLVLRRRQPPRQQPKVSPRGRSPPGVIVVTAAYRLNITAFAAPGMQQEIGVGNFKGSSMSSNRW